MSLKPPSGCAICMITWSTLYFLSEWAIRLAMLFYVPNRRSPAAARSWLLLIFLFPWPGLIFYAALGRAYLSKDRIRDQMRASEIFRSRRFREQISSATAVDLPADIARFATLAAGLGDFRVLGGNEIQLLDEYGPSIDALIADIRAAKSHVHLLYYIFADDLTGRRVADALIDAQQRGIACRVLMDAVGAAKGLRGLAPRLQAAGVDVHAALPVGLFRKNTARIDLRNHRKLAVIDGRIGYTGSQNLVDPMFVKGYPNEELVARISGPVVGQLQAVFLADLYFETEKMPADLSHFPSLGATGNSPAQLIPSGPGYGRENAQAFMVDLIYGANKSVVITTPYFVPDQPFLQALSTAVRRGVRVDLVLSLHSNQAVTRLAQQSFFDELLEEGICIHLYRPHFLHAKHLTIDDRVAVLGSSNIDIRSFALNAEISLAIYDPAVVARLAVIQQKYFTNSDLLTKTSWGRRSIGLKTIQNIARLADALL